MSQPLLGGAENATVGEKKDQERVSQIRDSKLEALEQAVPSMATIAPAQKERSTSRVKMRKSSIGMSQIQGIKPVERTSHLGLEYKRPILTYLPTYQLDPIVRFNVTKVTKVIEETLDELFTEDIYNDYTSPALAVAIASCLVRNLKSLQFNRYRLLCLVTIAQRRAQSYNDAISFIWDSERDGYAEYHMQFSTTFVQVIVFGVYLD